MDFHSPSDKCKVCTLNFFRKVLDQTKAHPRQMENISSSRKPKTDIEKVNSVTVSLSGKCFIELWLIAEWSKRPSYIFCYLIKVANLAAIFIWCRV